MIITTIKTVNIFDYNEVWDHEYYETCCDDLCLLKGDASKAEQARADSLTTEQNALLKQSLGLQQAQLGAVNATVDPIIARGGMSAEEEGALTSLLTNQLGNTYKTGIGQVNSALVAKGLAGGQSGAGGGGVAGDFGQLAAALGNQQQQGLSNIQLQKAAELQSLLGLKIGIGSQYGANVSNFTRGQNESLGQGVTAGHNVDQAGTSFWGPIIGGSLGLGGNVITKYCWIARAVYGDGSPLAEFARIRLLSRSVNELKYKIIVFVYGLTGEYISKLVNKYDIVYKVFRILFDRFIDQEMRKI